MIYRRAWYDQCDLSIRRLFQRLRPLFVRPARLRHAHGLPDIKQALVLPSVRPEVCLPQALKAHVHHHGQHAHRPTRPQHHYVAVLKPLKPTMMVSKCFGAYGVEAMAAVPMLMMTEVRTSGQPHRHG
jgi:hypothetical protein